MPQAERLAPAARPKATAAEATAVLGPKATEKPASAPGLEATATSSEAGTGPGA